MSNKPTSITMHIDAEQVEDILRAHFLKLEICQDGHESKTAEFQFLSDDHEPLKNGFVAQVDIEF